MLKLETAIYKGRYKENCTGGANSSIRREHAGFIMPQAMPYRKRPMRKIVKFPNDNNTWISMAIMVRIGVARRHLTRPNLKKYGAKTLDKATPSNGKKFPQPIIESVSVWLNCLLRTSFSWLRAPIMKPIWQPCSPASINKNVNSSRFPLKTNFRTSESLTVFLSWL